MKETISEFIARATANPVDVKVGKVLEVWGVPFRTWEDVARIRQDLKDAGLRCEPDIEKGGKRSMVRVGIPAPSPDEGTESSIASDGSEPDEPLQLPPVALLIKDIPSATCEVQCVSPNDTLKHAQTVMSWHTYSQLAVMSGDRELEGAVSWRSIAEEQIRLGKADITLAEATVQPAEVRADAPLLSQIPVICKNDFVFVRNDEDRVCGIVTATDLTEKFGDLTTPYFQLGEFERRLRRCIRRRFTDDQLLEATGKESPDEMEFGHYLTLLDDEARWPRMQWNHYERTVVISCLDDVRKLRNRVMHFGRELEPSEKTRLEDCLNFMRSLDQRTGAGG